MDPAPVSENVSGAALVEDASEGQEEAAVKNPDDAGNIRDESKATFDAGANDDMDDADDVKSMFKSMMRMMKSVKKEVAEVKDQTANAFDKFRTEVHEDFFRIDAMFQ